MNFARFYRPLRLACLAALTLSCACTANLLSPDSREEQCDDCENGDIPDTDDVGDTATPPGVLGVGWSTRYPRLSHAQWENTVRDLFRLETTLGLAATFALDPDASAFDTYSARTVSANLWNDYQRAAEEIARETIANPELLQRIRPASADSENFIREFGQRAFRRPLNEDEFESYRRLFAQAGTLFPDSTPEESGVELVIRAFLQSPHFLYRVEASTQADGERIWLNDFEVASRLSYALWNTMPSDELLQAAAAGELASEQGVSAWTAKMLNDPRAVAPLVSFHEQFFHTESYGTVAKNETLFPSFTPELAPVLQEEASRFFEEIIVKNDGGISALLTTPTTYVNNVTATFYGLSGTFDEALTRVDLDPSQRAGILTHVGFLSRYGSQTQSDPILRGVHMSLELLCSDLPPPPNGIPPLPAILEGQTNRARVEQSTSVQPCATCHETFINPLGFAFENYDAIGKWRDTDNGQAVDASDTYSIDGTDVAYANAVELSSILADSQVLHACYAKKWLEYVLGRPPADEEKETLIEVAETSKNSPSLRALLSSLTTLDTFRARPPEMSSP